MSRSQRTLNAHRYGIYQVRPLSYEIYSTNRASENLKKSKRVASMFLNAFNDFQVYGTDGNDCDFASLRAGVK